MTAPSPVIPRSDDEPRGPNKLLLGCGVFALLAVLFTVYVGTWLFGTGDQVSTDAVLATDSPSYMRFAPRPGDEGVLALADAVFRAVDKRTRELEGTGEQPFAEYLERAQAYQGHGSEWLLPREATISKNAGDGEGWVAAVNFDGYGGLIRGLHDVMALGAEEEAPDSVVHHGEHTLVDVEGVWAARVGTTILIGTPASAVQDALDRTDLPSVPAPAAVEAIDALLADRFDAVLVSAAPGPIRDALAPEDVTEPYDRIDAAGIGFDVISADRTDGTLHLHAADPAAAEALAQALTESAPRLIGQLGERGLTLAYETAAQGRFTSVEFQLRGVERAITRLLESVEDLDDAEE